MKRNFFCIMALSAIITLSTVQANAQTSATTQRNGTTTYHHPELGGMNVTVKPLTPEEHKKAIQRDKVAKEQEIKRNGSMVASTQKNAVNLDGKAEQITEEQKAKFIELANQKGKEKALAIVRKRSINNLTVTYGIEEATRITNLKIEALTKLIK